MLEAVGHPHAVNPDRELRRIGDRPGLAGAGLHRPVALRSRVPLPPARPTLAALAVGGALAAGGVLWANARKRRDGGLSVDRTERWRSQPLNARQDRRTTESHNSTDST